jgi:hypothetical protein
MWPTQASRLEERVKKSVFHQNLKNVRLSADFLASLTLKNNRKPWRLISPRVHHPSSPGNRKFGPRNLRLAPKFMSAFRTEPKFHQDYPSQFSSLMLIRSRISLNSWRTAQQQGVILSGAPDAQRNTSFYGD